MYGFWYFNCLFTGYDGKFRANKGFLRHDLSLFQSRMFKRSDGYFIYNDLLTKTC